MRCVLSLGLIVFLFVECSKSAEESHPPKKETPVKASDDQQKPKNKNKQIVKKQSKGLEGAKITVHGAYNYSGYTDITPTKTTKMISVDVEFSNFSNEFDLEEIDIIDGKTDKNFGNNSQIELMNPEGSIAGKHHKFPKSPGPIRVLLIYAVPKKLNSIKLGYWESILTQSSVPLKPGGPKLEKPIEIKAGDETVYGHQAKEEDFPQKISPIKKSEKLKFIQWKKDSLKFLKKYPSKDNDELKKFDSAFKSWMESKEKKYSDQDVINLLGAYLGQRLVDDFGMEWVFVSDKYGKAYAVQHPKTRLMGFPFASVSKRIEDNETDFLFGVYHLIKHNIEKAQKAP